jgi:hypothetical protein
MKRFIKSQTYIILLILSVQVCSAQIENIVIDENTNIDKLYSGLYSRLEGEVDSLKFDKKISFRVGFRATHNLNSIFSINAQTALQIENDKPLLSIFDCAFITKISKKLQLRLGSFATPTTLLRPNPTTWQSQTETYAQSRIISGRIGALLSYSFNTKQVLNLGYHYQNDQWATHLMFKTGGLGLGGWVQQNGDYFGIIDYQNKKVKMTLNYSSISEEWSNAVFYNLSERYSIYTDVNYRVNLDKTEICRLGVRSYFDSKKIPVGGFFALQYDLATDLASLQLFISLN